MTSFPLHWLYIYGASMTSSRRRQSSGVYWSVVHQSADRTRSYVICSRQQVEQIDIAMSSTVVMSRCHNRCFVDFHVRNITVLPTITSLSLFGEVGNVLALGSTTSCMTNDKNLYSLILLNFLKWNAIWKWWKQFALVIWARPILLCFRSRSIYVSVTTPTYLRDLTYVDQQALKPDDDISFCLINFWTFDVGLLVCPLSATVCFLSQPLVCRAFFHCTSSFAIVLNHISSHFLNRFWLFSYLHSARAVTCHFGHHNRFYIFTARCTSAY